MRQQLKLFINNNFYRWLPLTLWNQAPFSFLLFGLTLKKSLLLYLGLIVLWIFSEPLSSNKIFRTAERWEDHLFPRDMITSDIIAVISSGGVLAPGDSLVSE